MMVTLKGWNSRLLGLCFFLFTVGSSSCGEIGNRVIPTVQECSMLTTFFEVEDTTTLFLSYMAYACGECRPQYRVDSVEYSAMGLDSFYLNKEIYVNFEETDLQRTEDSLNCNTYCYLYRVSGGFRRNEVGMGKIEVWDGNIRVVDDACCLR